jgi:hypothetical protein
MSCSGAEDREAVSPGSGTPGSGTPGRNARGVQPKAADSPRLRHGIVRALSIGRARRSTMKRMAVVVAALGVMALTAEAAVPERWLPMPESVLRPIELVCTGDDCNAPEPARPAAEPLTSRA